MLLKHVSDLDYAFGLSIHNATGYRGAAKTGKQLGHVFPGFSL